MLKEFKPRNLHDSAGHSNRTRIETHTLWHYCRMLKGIQQDIPTEQGLKPFWDTVSVFAPPEFSRTFQQNKD